MQTSSEPSDHEVEIYVPVFLSGYVTEPIKTGVHSLNPLQVVKVDTLGVHFKQEFIFETAKLIARQAQNQLERACRKYIEAEVRKELDQLARNNDLSTMLSAVNTEENRRNPYSLSVTT